MNLIAKTDTLHLYLVGRSDNDTRGIYFVRSPHDDYWGRISWFNPWQRFVFNPASDVVLYEAKCLRQIADWCEQRTAEEK